MMRLVLALIFFGFALNVAQAADSEGRRMLIFAIYGAAGTTGSAATTTVIWSHAGRNAVQRNQHLKAPGFHVFATCVEP